MSEVYEFHRYSVYFAPRGSERLLALGDQITTRHLRYTDKLIAVVGDAGSGKSLIIKGMFPGLMLSNDDDAIDVHKIMQVKRDLDTDYQNTTYHLDMRFQLAFTQMFEVVDFIKGALKRGRRVIVEHFDLIYPYIKIKADVMIGIGDEIIVTRPNMFGPFPQDIADTVFTSLKYRKMAHTAEDITTLVLHKHYDMPQERMRSDVCRGFVLNYEQKPHFDLYELERKVIEVLNLNLDVSYYDDQHILIGETEIQECQGPRIHVRNTSDVENYELVKEVFYDDSSGLYAIVGLVGNNTSHDIEDLNKIE